MWEIVRKVFNWDFILEQKIKNLKTEFYTESK